VCLLFLAVVGLAGYEVGRPPGADLDEVRTAAIEEGSERGAKTGAKEGYAEGLRAAGKRTYFPAYAEAYREAFLAEFEAAGLAPPQTVEVPRRR
jgi:hypothetical protein